MFDILKQKIELELIYVFYHIDFSKHNVQFYFTHLDTSFGRILCNNTSIK